MTLADRVTSYVGAFPRWEASWPRIVQEQGRNVLYATWVIGNDYRGTTRFYGAYPPTYLARVMALFPDALGSETLHVFSGSLPEGNYVRCDIAQSAELPCSVYDLPQRVGAFLFRLILADPPYSAADAERYQTKPVDRRRALASLAAIAHPGAYLAWLDTCWPMHSKKQWLTVGRILVQRSTNHRARVLTIFERVA